LRLRPATKQEIQFFVTAHQRRQRAAATIGVEPTFCRQGALHPPGVNRLGDAFQVTFAKIG
jgi:hypothetical protein